ncbi:hypothetical protein [Stutzerimonas chloritidismutans]|uniref:Transposase n=1 Tax=Stutzerimonas chloritidismutans TaxID=203192 RepID=A0ABU9MAJ5_STUCH
MEKSPASVFENAAVVVLPDDFAALRQLLLTRLLPCGRVYGVRAIRSLVSTMAAELRQMKTNRTGRRRAVMRPNVPVLQ